MEIEGARKKGRKLYVAAVDLKKAFDLVKREYMVEYLKKAGWEQEWVECLRALYREEELELYMNGEQVGRVRRNEGIKQGCKVSPLLFVLCLNAVIDKVNQIWKEER